MDKDKKYFISNITEHQIKDGNMEVWGTEASDEYHTMSELYDHRRALTVALFNTLYEQTPYTPCKTKLHHDGTMFPGYFMVFVNLGSGYISYHYALEHWDKFAIKEVDRGPDYDGHTSKDVIERLEKF